MENAYNDRTDDEQIGLMLHHDEDGDDDGDMAKEERSRSMCMKC